MGFNSAFKGLKITHTHLFGSNDVRSMLTSSHQASWYIP